MSIETTVKEFVVSEYLPGTPVEELDSGYDLLATGVVDSLSLLQLITWVETQYGISTDDVEISPDNFRSIDAICDFIDSAGKRQGQSTEWAGQS